MNEPSATPASPEDGSGIEAELTRRLDDLGTTTVGDIDATWEQIQARLASAGRTKRAFPGLGHRNGPRLVLAAAAAVVVVLGVALVIVGGRDRDDDVRIADQTTTTIERPTPDPPREPPPRPTSTTATSGTAPEAPTGETEGTGGGDDQGQEPDGDAGEASGGPATPSDPVAPREPAELRYILDGYSVEIVYVDGTIYFRRSDGLGSTRPGPDAYGHLDSANWGALSGPRCLTSAGGEYTFEDGRRLGFSYGLIGDDIDAVMIVLTDGRRERAARWSHVEPEIATWSTLRPLGQVDRIEGLDASGEVIVTIADPDGDYGSAEC